MKMFLSVLAVALAAQISAQDVDPAVMRINGHDVLSSEFKYYFNKNRDQQLSEGQMTPQEYAPLFIAYKLKALCLTSPSLTALRPLVVIRLEKSSAKLRQRARQNIVKSIVRTFEERYLFLFVIKR